MRRVDLVEYRNKFRTFAAQTALSLPCLRVGERKVRATQGTMLLNRKAGESLQ